MSLEFEVEADVQIDIQPEIEVEVEIDVAPEIEIEVEAEVDAEIEVEVEVPCVEVEVVADADFNADLVVESNLAEPIVDVELEVGGNVSSTSSGGVCNLVCSILFLCFFVGDIVSLICLLVSWSYYATTIMNSSHVTRAQADTTMTIAVVGVSCGAVLWGILALCCCRCAKANKGQMHGTHTTYQVEQVTTYEVGGGANVDFEVEIEVPQVEVEVELCAPEIEVEVEVCAPEIEIEVEAEVEVEAEIEVDAGVEVELEVEL